jgi:hypothetical protein
MSNSSRTFGGWLGAFAGALVAEVAAPVQFVKSVIEGDSIEKAGQKTWETLEDCVEGGAKIGDDNNDAIKTVAFLGVSLFTGHHHDDDGSDHSSS